VKAWLTVLTFPFTRSGLNHLWLSRGLSLNFRSIFFLFRVYLALCGKEEIMLRKRALAAIWLGTLALLVVPGTSWAQSFEPRAENLGNQVLVRVRVPSPDARVWIQDMLSQRQGTERLFISPPLEAGSTYSYIIRASWMENGKEVSRDQKVRVTPGQPATVAFAGPEDQNREGAAVAPLGGTAPLGQFADQPGGARAKEKGVTGKPPPPKPGYPSPDTISPVPAPTPAPGAAPGLAPAGGVGSGNPSSATGGARPTGGTRPGSPGTGPATSGTIPSGSPGTGGTSGGTSGAGFRSPRR
jgi:uncharacterized protein (TIGR03000 family)